MAIFDGTEVEKAGDNGVPSASVTAIATESCFVDINIINSILKVCGLQALVATGLQSVRTGYAAALDVVRTQACKDQTCWQTAKVESGYQQFVKGIGDLAEWRFLRSERFVTLLCK
jgi:hypothetical protein